MPNIIIGQTYNHYNRALGCQVNNKDHYERLMKEGNFITYEESIERSKNNGNKPYILSKDARDVIIAAKNRKNSKGKVRLDGQLGEKLIKMGAINKTIPDYMKLPSHYTKGGFTK